jgi:hypothetical protein
MLGAFEAALADLVADTMPALPAPLRRLPASLPPTGVQPVVRLLGAESIASLGDDAPQVRRRPDGGLGLRVRLALRGEAAIDLVAAAGLARADHWAALDTLLAGLQEEGVRSGAVFDDGTDRGFLLRSFRLRRAGPAPGEGVVPPASLQAVFGFEGEFWPVRAEPEGPAIVSIPARLVVLPVERPEALIARAGGPDLQIPLRLDLRALGGAPAQVVARLRGAAPPGTLVGDPAPGFAAGAVAVTVDEVGTANLAFRPAATLAARGTARIAASLAAAGRPTVALAELAVEVLP